MVQRRFRALWTGALFAILALAGIGPAAAQVRFGSSVRIGGHDFSQRRAGSVHVERVRRLRGPLGCRSLRNGFYRRGDGSVMRGPMEACNLIAVPHHRRR